MLTFLLTLPQSTPDYSFVNVNIYIFHWIPSVYIFIGGSRGGVRDARPPWASKFFRFHAVFGKIWRVHAPPGGFTPPLGKILDPPLLTIHRFYNFPCRFLVSNFCRRLSTWWYNFLIVSMFVALPHPTAEQSLSADTWWWHSSQRLPVYRRTSSLDISKTLDE